MKKLLLLGLLSLSVVGLSGPTVRAEWFHWLHRRCGCTGRYTTTIHVHPYNAFTPACYGSLFCDGCCPVTSCGMGCGSPCPMPCMPQMPCCAPPCCEPPPWMMAMGGPQGCCSSGCCDQDCLPAPGNYLQQAPPAPTGPAGPAPITPSTPPAPNFTPPMPTPLPSSMSYNWANAVQPVGYYGYYPGYYPGYAAYNPWMNGYAPGYYPGYAPAYNPGYVPSYWYGGTR